MSNKKTIVVIDDEPDTIELVEIVLGMEGFSVVSFTDATSAFSSLKDDRINPDLILLDIRMPRVSGIDFCKMVRADPVLKDLKIVFFTASSGESRTLLKEYDVLGYVLKPLDNAALVKAVRKWSS